MRQWINLFESKYRHGLCDAMAVALHEIYGYPLGLWRGYYLDPYAEGEDGAEEAWEDAHACVMLPDGSWADVDGIHTEQPNLHFSSNVTRIELVPASMDEVCSAFTMGVIDPDDIDDAKEDAPILPRLQK